MLGKAATVPLLPHTKKEGIINSSQYMIIGYIFSLDVPLQLLTTTEYSDVSARRQQADGCYMTEMLSSSTPNICCLSVFCNSIWWRWPTALHSASGFKFIKQCLCKKGFFLKTLQRIAS